jgi:hypothetical protein
LFLGVADEPLKVQQLGLSVPSIGELPPMMFFPSSTICKGSLLRTWQQFLSTNSIK